MATNSVDETTQQGPVIAHPLRTDDGALSAAHSSFTVTSGILLWGQIVPMHHGSQQTAFTNSHGAGPPPRRNGTLPQHVLSYRSAARAGEWKVRRYLSNWRDEEDNGPDSPPTEHAGWVFCHADVDPMHAIRVAKGDEEGSDGPEDVFKVGRYDWVDSLEGQEGERSETRFQAWAEPAIGPVVPLGSYTPKCNVTSRGYFAAVDAQEWGLDFVRAYKRECEGESVDDVDEDGDGDGAGHRLWDPVERVLEKKEGEKFGAYVRMPGTDYEYGWLVFSGEQHARHDAQELIAIVYDGSSELLEGSLHAVEPEP